MNAPRFRPPAEADSLILQIDEGCPYNGCTFCGMYKGMRHRRRPLDEIRAIARAEARRWPGAHRIFLADGDVMARPATELLAILALLQEAFPDLRRVNTYATGSGIAGKTDAELAALRAARLQILYMGLESGDEATLAQVRKQETAAAMVEAGVRAQAAGLKLSVMVLLGLGGRARTAEHADATAAALNRMQPRLLSALRVVPVEGTRLAADLAAGRFAQLTEYEVIAELRRLVAGLALQRTVFRANHSSNVMPIEATLPRDQPRLLAELDALLAAGRLDRDSPGRLPLWL